MGQDSTWDLPTSSSPAEGILVASVHPSGCSLFMEQFLSFKRTNKQELGLETTLARLRCYKRQELKAEQEAADPFWMKAGMRVREVHTSISQRLELHLLLLFSSFSCSSLDSHRWAPRNQGEMGNGLILPLEPRRGLCVCLHNPRSSSARSRQGGWGLEQAGEENQSRWRGAGRDPMDAQSWGTWGAWEGQCESGSVHEDTGMFITPLRWHQGHRVTISQCVLCCGERGKIPQQWKNPVSCLGMSSGTQR